MTDVSRGNRKVANRSNVNGGVHVVGSGAYKFNIEPVYAQGPSNESNKAWDALIPRRLPCSTLCEIR